MGKIKGPWSKKKGKMKVLASKKNSKKSKVHVQKKLAKNQRLAVKKYWQIINGSWLEKHGIKSKFLGQRKMEKTKGPRSRKKGKKIKGLQ